MEPVTHFLTGACLGRSGFNRKTAYATLAMTLAAEAPDLDVFWGFRGPVAELQHHRGWTHSFVGTAVVALATVAFVWLLYRLRRKDPVIPPRWGWLLFCAWIAAMSHILLDYTVNYGVRPFFPWNGTWYAWSIVFIVDPWLLLALTLALVVPAILGLADREIGAGKELPRPSLAIAALVFMVLWWGLRNAEHDHALALIRAGNYTREPLVRVAAEPHVTNPFRWRILMETRDFFQTADVYTLGDVVTTDDYSDVIYKPPVTPAVAAAKRSISAASIWTGRNGPSFRTRARPRRRVPTLRSPAGMPSSSRTCASAMGRSPQAVPRRSLDGLSSALAARSRECICPGTSRSNSTVDPMNGPFDKVATPP